MGYLGARCAKLASMVAEAHSGAESRVPVHMTKQLTAQSGTRLQGRRRGREDPEEMSVKNETSFRMFLSHMQTWKPNHSTGK